MNDSLSELDHSSDDFNDHRVVVAKISAMICLFIATLAFGSLPFKLINFLHLNDENRPDSNTGKTISGLLSFGGGVLMSTTFVHLIPEVDEQIIVLQKSGSMTHLPFSISAVLMCTGFFLMYLIHELVHSYMITHAESNPPEEAFKRGISGRESSLRKRPANQKPTDESANVRNTLEISHPPENQHHSHIHIAQLTNDDDVFISSLRGLLVVLALSIHELFEGFAVGLESSSTAVWYMFAAVSAHKLVLAFCVGVELVITKTKFWLSLVYIFTFAIVSPIGIGIGTLLTNNEDNSSTKIAAVILQGLACGTLLYVIFFEILSKEKRASGLLQFLLVVIGFAFMFGLQILTGHGHSHGGHSDGHSHNHNHTHNEPGAMNSTT